MSRQSLFFRIKCSSINLLRRKNARRCARPARLAIRLGFGALAQVRATQGKGCEPPRASERAAEKRAWRAAILFPTPHLASCAGQAKGRRLASSDLHPFEARIATTREGTKLKAEALLAREWNGRLERVMILDPKFGVGDSFPRSRAKARRPGRTVSADHSFRANALNSRGIVGPGKSRRFARTTWWWTQSGQTGLRH
jgi:hypothetical protein